MTTRRITAEQAERLAGPTPSTNGPPTAPVGDRGALVERARKYLAKVPPAVSGQHGHDQAFKAACRAALGFNLTLPEALEALAEWNQTCQPPWDERELRHKVEDALKQPGERGFLLGRRGAGGDSFRVSDLYRGETKNETGPQPPAGHNPLPFPPIRHISELTRPPGERWLVDGYLARGKFTLLTALWKVGKTTWLAHLLKGFKDGGLFCGRAQQAGRVLYVTEEDEDLWVDRREEIGLGDCPVHVLTQPFGFARANGARWSELLCYLAEFQAGPTPADLIVFDTLSNLWPVSDENDAAKVGEALAPIRLLTTRMPYPGALLNHHNRKTDGPEFTGTRGSGALPSFVDIILEMRRFDPVDDDDCRRVIKGGGRFRKNTPAELVVELTDSGFEARGSKGEVARASLEDVIGGILADGVGRTWQGVRDDWPGDKAPATQKLLEALNDGFNAGRWSRDGEGRRNSPHLYVIGQPQIADEPIPE